jgi:hypothetical protein
LVIRADIAQANSPETLGPQDQKRLHSISGVEVVVVLALVDFRLRDQVARALDRPALQTIRLDRGMGWLDPEGLEVKANPLPRFILRLEPRIVLEVGGILSVSGAENAARGDFDDASVVDVAAALRFDKDDVSS